VKLVRALVPRLVELYARKVMPGADRAALADIEKRGAAEASLVGPGAKAAADRERAL
jgi:hypothetical protein